MVRSTLFVLAILVGQSWLLTAQTTLKVQSVEHLPPGSKLLMTSDDYLRQNLVPREQLTDMVSAFTVDSTVNRRYQYLQGALGVIGQAFNRHWEKMDDVKRKYVGTSSRDFHIYDGPFAELDMNIFLIPHLPFYLSMANTAFDKAKERGRKEVHFKYDNPDFAVDSSLWNAEYGFYTVECEGTPPEEYQESFAEAFLPISEGDYSYEELRGFGVKSPTFGLYGPWVMDCNHNCRPEIHPFEWMWWTDLSVDRPGPDLGRSWKFALLSDGSKRFKDWSPSPRIGEISFPVIFPSSATFVAIQLETILRSDMVDNKLSQAFLNMGREESVILEGDFNHTIEMLIKPSGDTPLTGLAWEFRNAQYSPQDRLIYGEFVLRIATKDLYAGRVTMDYSK